jgi:hypothetical protein
VHGHCTYDFEVDGMRDVEENASAVLAAWQAREAPGAFRRMLAGE